MNGKCAMVGIRISHFTLRISFIFFGSISSLALPQSLDSILVIDKPEESFPLNRYTHIHRDLDGRMNFTELEKGKASFFPLNNEFFQFHEDQELKALWGRTYVDNRTGKALRYVLYFHPGVDTVQFWIHNPDGNVQESMLSPLNSISQRPLRITQELCSPVLIQPGMTTIFFRLSNSTIYNKELGSLIVNLAEEKTFVNYFLKARTYQGFALGIIAIMVFFHFIIYLFFRDTTYLLFVVNLFFTLVYLLILKHFHEELPFLSNYVSLLRYLRNPVGVLICITSLLFTQSFLNTRQEDPLVHQLMNIVMIFALLVVLGMAFLQFLWVMEILSIYLACATFLSVLITSVRIYRKGNPLAIYPFLGFLGFIISVLLFFFPLSYTDYRSNETDSHYYAEAFRAMVFAVGVADRFRRVRRESVRVELEKNQIAFEKELQLQAEKDRIRQELHDSLGGQLSSISVGLNQLIKTDKNGTLNAIQSIADRAVTELRDSLWVLDKGEMDVDELAQRIHTLFWQYRKTEVPIEFELKMNGSGTRLSSLITGHLFRIVQEAVQNAVKHSEAKKITVTLDIINNLLALAISDNGKGFNHPTANGQDHYGLHNMQKRAEQIKAKCSIESHPLQGTTIRVEMKTGTPAG